MKPHRLRFAGIGAYPGLVEIDFDDLGELGLYLVVGPTGSGKTTIFDAITFALYGELAGARNKATLASDHTHRESPYVEIDFSHRNAHYRLHRVPPVNGRSAKTNDVWMAEYADEQFVEPAIGRITGATNVTDRVTSIIGLDADQFMRVMLLPQNEFQQFLLANSTKKEELLRALFGTTLYERIAIELTESAKQLGIDARRSAQQIDAVQVSIRSQVDTVIAEGLGATLPDPTLDLPGAISELRALHATASREATTAAAHVAAATAARATAGGEAKRYDAGLELAALEEVERSEAAQVVDAVQRLKSDERAQRVVQAIVARDAAKVALDGAIQRVTTNRAELVAALAAAPLHVPVLKGLRGLAASASPPVLAAELATAEASVERALATFGHAARAASSAAEHDATAAAADIATGEFRDRIDEYADTIQAATVGLAAARTLTDSFPELDRELSALDDRIARADADGAAAQLVTTQATLDAANAALRVVTDELAGARRARTMHLAGELAKNLQDGHACPVCGSTDHPLKAAPADGADVTELEDRRTTATVAVSAAEAELNTAHDHKVTVDMLAAALPSPEEQQILRRRHAEAGAAQATRSELDVALASAHLELTAITAELTASGARAAQHRENAERLRVEAATQRAVAAAVIDESVAEVVAQALVDAGHFITGLGSAVSELEVATGGRGSTDQQLLDSLLAEGFPDETTASAAVLGEQQRNSLTGLVHTSAARNSRIIECRAVVGDTPPPPERPDLEGLEAAERASLVMSHRAASHVTTLGNATTSIEQSALQLDMLAPDVERQRVRAQRAEHLAKIMKTGSSDTLGIERWVQRSVFEEVCDVASVQLLTLSSGRYVLTLEASGSTSRKVTAGLDLFVTDSHTGATRAVGTLSGGEQFLTSLALALALAEVVQRRSGGIELATLFIDEGFGSLDGQTLDTAVEVLRALQDTGRTVGVISHVDAMQQELRIGIRVKPGPTGSTLSVHPNLA